MQELILRFIGLDMVSPVTRGIGASIADLEAQSATAGGKSASVMASAGQAAMLTGTAGIAGFLGLTALIKSTTGNAAELDYQLNLLQTHANMPSDPAYIAQMKQGLLDTSKYGFDASQSAQAMYYIQSAGIHDVKDALAVLGASEKTAQMTHADLNATTYSMVSTFNALPGAFKSSSEEAGILNGIVGSGIMTFNDFNMAVKSGVFGTGAIAGSNIKEIGALMDTLTQKGFPAASAAQVIRNNFLQLANIHPDTKTDLWLKSIGINQESIARDMVTPGKGMVFALNELKNALDKLPHETQLEVLDKLFRGTKGAGQTAVMLESLKDIPTSLADIDRSAANFDANWEKTAKLATVNAATLKASIWDLKATVGDALMPMLQQFYAWAINLVATVGTWVSGHKELIATLVQAGLKFFAFLTAISGGIFLFEKFKTFLGPVGLAITAITLAAGFLATHWGEVTKIAGEFYAAIQPLIAALQGVFGPIVQHMIAGFHSAVSGGSSVWERLRGAIADMASVVAKFITDHGPQIVRVFNTIFDTAMRLGGWIIGTFIPDVWGRLSSAVRLLADWFTTYVLPTLVSVYDWFAGPGGDAIKRFGESVLGALPGLERLVGLVIEVAGWIWANIGKPLLDVAEIVIPPILTALAFLNDHFHLLTWAASGFVIYLGIITGMGLASWALNAYGAVAQLTRAFIEMNGAQALGGAITNIRTFFAFLATKIGLGGLVAGAGEGAVAGAVGGAAVGAGEGAAVDVGFAAALAVQTEALLAGLVAQTEALCICCGGGKVLEGLAPAGEVAGAGAVAATGAEAAGQLALPLGETAGQMTLPFVGEIATATPVIADATAGVGLLGEAFAGVAAIVGFIAGAPLWAIVGVIALIVAGAALVYHYWDQISGAIGTAAQWVGDMASRFGGWVESVGGDIANLGKAFGSEMESWGGQIHGLATNFKNLIGDWMGDIGGLGKRFGSEMDSWGHQIGKFFQDLPGRIGGFFSSIPSALGTALGAAAYGVGSFAAQLVTDITRIPGAIGSAGRAIGSQVESWSGDLKNLGENFYGMVESWGPKIDAFVTGSGPAIGNWAKSWTSDIVATGARFTSMVTSWGGDIYKFGQTLTTGAGTWGNAIGRFVTSAGRDIGSWATSFGSAVANISTAVGGFVVNTLPQWWDRATTAVENFMYSLLSDIGGLPGKIMGYFGDAGSWLYNAGRNIITGLWQGVSDEAGRFFGWMGGLKDSFVHGWQQHWQSGSPSQVAAREMGLPIAQGIALGITQGTGLVTSSLTSVIPQGPVKTPAIAMPGLSVALAAGTATSAPSSSATTTQNDLLTRIANSLGLLVQQSAQNSPTSSQDVRRPTTGIEGKVYDLVQQVQQTRARGIRGNYL